MGTHTEHLAPFSAVTPRGANHFFGYYEKCPWSANGRYLLALESPFHDRMPTASDAALVGIVDLHEGNRWRILGQTRAWNLQQGSMLHWLPTEPNRKIVCNDRRTGDLGHRFVGVIFDVFSGEAHDLPYPVYTLRPDGKQALSLSFSRLAHMRPVCGYQGVSDPNREVAAPENDGIRTMDMESGDSELAFTLAQAASMRPIDGMQGAKHWFNHLLYSPNGRHVAFLHRWRRPEEHWSTRLIVMNADGSDARILADEGMTSHFDWQGNDTLFGWLRLEGRNAYWRIDVRTGEAEVVAPDVLTSDGHCSFHPASRAKGDTRWLLTDTYPREKDQRGVILYDMAEDRRIDIGWFDSPPEFSDAIRCDLHPRWSRDGRQISIDSLHEGRRQVYVADVGEIVGR